MLHQKKLQNIKVFQQLYFMFQGNVSDSQLVHNILSQRADAQNLNPNHTILLSLYPAFKTPFKSKSHG